MTATTESTTYVDLQDSSILRLREQGAAEPFSVRQLGWLLVITVVAGVLRLHELGTWSLWVDEAHTYRDVTLPLRGEHGFFSQYRSWYPLSFLMLRGLLGTGLLASVSEGWLRLPFAFCGIVSVPLLALVGNQFVGRRAALFAAALLALNPWHIYWSQNARGYVMVFFFATLAAGVFWQGCVRQRWPWLLGGVVLAGIGGMFHPTCLLLLTPFLVFPLLARVTDFQSRRFWVALMVGLLLLAVLPFVVQYLPPFEGFLRAKPDASLGHFLQTTAFYFRVPLLLAAAVGVWLLFQTSMQGRVLFLACWFLVPLLALSVLSLSVVKATARYAFCALPAVMLLASAASLKLGDAIAEGLGRKARSMRWLPAAILPVILCGDMAAYDWLYFRTQHGDRALWREAADLVLRQSGGRPVKVLALPAPSLQYYLRPDQWRRPGGADPHPERQVVPINSWDVFDDTDRKSHPEFYGGNGFLRRARAAARTAGQELFAAVQMPELHEIDRDGSLLAGLREHLELVTVLPCWVGPKDESIWVFRLTDEGDAARKPGAGAANGARPGGGQAPTPATPKSGADKSKEAGAKSTGADKPKSTGADKPKDTGAKPKDAGAKPKDAGAKPKDAGTKPKDAGAKPKEAGAKPRDAAADKTGKPAATPPKAPARSP